MEILSFLQTKTKDRLSINKVALFGRALHKLGISSQMCIRDRHPSLLYNVPSLYIMWCGALFPWKEASALKSVSYTHLDVYKRQVHDAAGTIITDGKLTLNERCGTLLVNNNETGCILEQRIETSHIHLPQITSCIFIHIDVYKRQSVSRSKKKSWYSVSSCGVKGMGRKILK